MKVARAGDTYLIGIAVPVETVERVAEAASRAKYGDWEIEVVNATLKVTHPEADSEGRGRVDIVSTYPISPDAAADPSRWVFSRLLDIECHEAREKFLVDGRPLYFPDHGVQAWPTWRETE